MEHLWNKIGLIGCKYSSLSAPGSHNPWCHPLFKSSLFPFSAPAASFLPLSIMGGWVKSKDHMIFDLIDLFDRIPFRLI